MKRRLVALTCLPVLLLALTSQTAPAQAAAPEALNYASADAAVVVVVPNLSQANARLAAFFKSIGIEDPQSQDPIGTVLAQVGAVQGVDLNGSAVLVMPDLQFMPTEPPMYLVLPIADQQQFLAGYTSATADATVSDMQVVQSAMGETVYVRFFDKYAVCGNDAAAVAAHAGAADGSAIVKNMGEVGARSVGNADVYVCLNLGKVGPMLQPFVAMGLAQWQMQMMNSPEMAAPMGGPEAAAAMVTMYSQLANVVLSESQAMALGFEFPEAGPTLNLAMQFKPQTGAANMFAQTPTAAPALDRLPDQPYLFAGAMDIRAIDWQPLIDAMNNVVLPQMAAETPGRALMETYAKSFEMLVMFNECEFAWYAPDPANAEAGLINMACIYGADDPAAVLAKYREVAQQMIAAQPSDQQVMKVTYSADVEQLNGKPVDEVVYDMSAVPGVENNPMMPGGKFTMRISTTDNAMIVGPNTASLQQLTETAGGSGKLGGESLAAARQNLPQGRFLEAYLNPGALMGMMMMADGMGGSTEEEQPTIPPLAVSGSSGGGGVAFSIHAPTALILGVKQMADAMSAPAPGEDEEWSEEEWTEEEWPEEETPVEEQGETQPEAPAQ